jgi:hypothetical protein
MGLSEKSAWRPSDTGPDARPFGGIQIIRDNTPGGFTVRVTLYEGRRENRRSRYQRPKYALTSHRPDASIGKNELKISAGPRTLQLVAI